MITRILLAFTFLVGLTSCFEQSVVIQINKDGSGIVHERIFVANQMGDMMEGMMEGIAEGIGEELTDDMTPKEKREFEKGLKQGLAEAGEDGSLTDELKPKKKAMKARAKEMGEGVVVEEIFASTNDAGWDGWETIFAFEDINKLRYNLNDMDGGLNIPELQEAMEEMAEGVPEEFITFTMKDGKITINLPESEEDPEVAENKKAKKGKKEPKVAEAEVVDEDAAADPFGDLPVVEADENNPAAFMMEMMGGMFEGMRAGIFVETTDEIAETNAEHVNGEMITIMLVDMEKMLSNPAGLMKMEALEEEESFSAMRAIAKGIPGITIESEDEVTIKLK